MVRGAERPGRILSPSPPVLAARFGWSDQYQALQAESNRTMAPQRLLARATQGYLEDVVGVQILAGLRGVSAAQVKAELAEAGLVPMSYGPSSYQKGEGPGLGHLPEPGGSGKGARSLRLLVLDAGRYRDADRSALLGAELGVLGQALRWP